MNLPQITYNPGILGDEKLARSFVVRQQSLELILEALQENIASPATNRHLIMIGPRGIGKTMLVRRAAAAIRSEADYNSRWYPIVFGEESYPVSTPGEFWLEALFHLADQTGDADMQKTFEELKDERDDARLRDRALAQLLDFSDHEGKRVLLVVENLNTLVGDQMNADAAWDLRHTLLNEARLMLLGTATNRFDEIENVGHAWFEMFSIHQLQPLNLKECGELWRSVTGESLAQNPLRAVRILTGGNPRLLGILAGFAANHSFRQLMEQLVHLIDDHTEYFKGHLDNLAVKERRVFVALLERWDPVSAAELARQTRLSVNEVSALVGRLCARGAVEVTNQKGRRKLYQASERLYNIYYLMRRRGHPEGRVQAAVQFMVTFYQREELATRLGDLAREACALPEDIRKDHHYAYREVLRKVQDITLQAIECTPSEFFQTADAKSTREIGVSGLVKEAHSLYHQEKLQESEKLYRRALVLDADDARAWSGLVAILYEDPMRIGEAEHAAQKAKALDPNPATWHNLGIVLRRLRRWQEAEEAFSKAVSLDPKFTASWDNLGLALSYLGRWEEAEEAMSKAVSLNPEFADSWDRLGWIRSALNMLPEAEQASRKAIELEPNRSVYWNNLAVSLWHMDRLVEAEQAFRKSIELDSNYSSPWRDLGHLLIQTGPPEEAEKVWTEALKLHGEELASCAVHLLDLRLARGEEPGSLVRDAEEWIVRSRERYKTMAVMAKFVATSRLKDYLHKAEAWAREAFANGEATDTAEALFLVLAELNKWEEAIICIKVILDASINDENAREASTELLIWAAAAGWANKALEALKGCQGATALEPLMVGLEIYLDKTPVVAKEILEIGHDVAERIRRYASERYSSLAASNESTLQNRTSTAD
jgi:tetratricopeptide (TPR) repeat protein